MMKNLFEGFQLKFRYLCYMLKKLCVFSNFIQQIVRIYRIKLKLVCKISKMHHIHKNNRYKIQKNNKLYLFSCSRFSKLILPSSSYFLDCTDTVRVVKVVTIIINVVQNFAYIINVVFFINQMIQQLVGSNFFK